MTFALNYNSANFRKDTAATWKMGRDSGYGFGWKFLAGSLTAYYTDWYTVHHYTFTDSTGAEYRLNSQSNGIWYSKEAIYVRYDPARNQFYFPDGSFWEFGAVLSGIEEDAGTMYPTKMQDTNGNFIAITYQTGTYAIEPQSSSRIAVIEDARAESLLGTIYGNVNGTYWMLYTADVTPHLASINSISAVGVGYTFSMTANVPLNSPFDGDFFTFGTTSRLQSLTGAYGLQHTFTYNTNNSGELTKVAFPYGGSLGWEFRDFIFSDSRVIRDMRYRTLNDGVNGNKIYNFWHTDTHDLNTSNHYLTVVDDPSLSSSKQWVFDNTTTLQVGLWEIGYQSASPGYYIARATTLFWTTDSDGNPYIADSYSTIDPNTGNQQIARTNQTRDNFGNLLQMKVYDYNNQITPSRTYNNTFRTDSAYTSRYIRNLLSTSTVTPTGAATIPLATNYYDQECAVYNPTSPPDTTHQFDSTYNANGATYRGNLCQSTTLSGVRKMTYDRAGTVTSTQDALGHTVTATPDPNHNYAVPSAVTTGNLTTTMQWNGAFQPTGSTSPNGATTAMAYDAYARPAGTTSPYGAATTIGYENSGTKTVTINGRWTKATTDGFGRAVKVESGNGTTTLSASETEYAPCGCTPMGKPKRVSQSHAPGATVYWTTYTYDALGRTTAVSHPNNTGVTSYTYAGNTVTVTDPAGKWKKFTTDATGNLTMVAEPRPGGGEDYLTFYAYNVFSQLLTVSMTRSGVTQTRTFEYDGIRVNSVTNPENGKTSFTYNADGTMNTRTDAKLQTLKYEYDYMGRLQYVKQLLPNNQTTLLRTYTYDSNGWPGATYLTGRLARVDYGNKWSELYSYHRAGARTAKRLAITGPNYNQSNPKLTLDAFWTYNNEGQMVSAKYPNTTGWDTYGQPFTVNSDTYTYTFDAMARPTDLTVTPGTPGDGSTGTYKQAQGATYGPAGELTALQYLQQATYEQDHWQTTYINEGRSYNARMQLGSIGATGVGGTIANISYSYYDVAANQSPDLTKNNGKVGQMTQTIGGNTEVVNYKYDSLNRLIAAYTSDTSQWGLAWEYDGFGNRGNQTVTQGSAPPMTGGADPATNRSGASDANGNLSSVNGFAMTYDLENRLTIAQSIYNGSDNYDYAPDNKRIYKKTQINNDVHEYVYFYSGNRKLATYEIGCYSPNPQTTCTPYFMVSSTNVYFAGKLIQAEGTPVVLDRLGSVVWDGAKGAHRYYPYGEERTSTTNESLKFGTYFRDKTTGLDYAVNRYFSSSTGRFTSPDSFSGSSPANPASWNKYAYASNDPINRVDPLGLFGYEPDPDPWPDPEPEPEPPPDPQQPVPATGGGNSGPQQYDIKKAKGHQTTLDMLDSQDCAEAVGAVNGEAAKSTLNSVTFQMDDFGPPTGTPVLGAPPGTYQFRWYGAETKGTTITLNSSVFLDPNQIMKGTTITLLQELKMEFGVAFTTEQFQALVILHEIGHVLNKFPNEYDPNTGNYDLSMGRLANLAVLKGCFGGGQ